MDEKGSLEARGVSGEIWVGGAGLSRGYLNNQSLSEEKFIDHPYAAGQKLYRTGDLGRWTPGGYIEFLGRSDNQLKIRGYRIEPGEIENCLLNYQGIHSAAVLGEHREQRGIELVAYIVSQDEPEGSQIKDYLSAQLPPHMVPSHFVLLQELPLTSNGKVDRAALKTLDGQLLDHGSTYVAPQNEVEQKLAQIWAAVLGVEQIGIKDNFFDLGGHSLMVVQVVNAVEKAFGLRIGIQDFFEQPTIEHTALLAQSGDGQATYQPKSESYPLTAAQHRLWVLSQLEGGSLAYSMPLALRLVGELSAHIFEQAIRVLIERHEILRTAFRPDASGQIRQYILSKQNIDFSLERRDYTEQANASIMVDRYMAQALNSPFDLETGTLIKGALLKVGTNKEGKKESIFFATMHHIIGDGWSWELIISEIIKIYNGLSAGEDVELTTLSIQYKDYAVWQQSDKVLEQRAQSQKYWLARFSGQLPVLDLPTLKGRPRINTHKGANIMRTYDAPFMDKLKGFSQQHEATLDTHGRGQCTALPIYQTG